MAKTNKITYIDNFRKTNSVVPPKKSRDNGGNGGGNMENKDFVTHTELKLSNEKMLHHMDNRFGDIDKHLTGIEHDIKAISKLQWWIMGLISAGIIVPLITLAFKAIFK